MLLFRQPDLSLHLIVMNNSEQNLYDYFKPGLSTEEMLREVFSTTPPETIPFHLRYLNRMLIENDSFCQMPQLFRADMIFFLDMLQNFFERVGEEQTLTN